MTTTITSKGQITIPKNVREKLNLETGDKLEFLLHDDGRLELLPKTSSITELKGILPKPKKALHLDEMEQVIKEAALDRH